MFAMRAFDLKNGSKCCYFFDLYKKSLDWSKDKLESFQRDKIKQLLIYSNKYVEFYRERFNTSGFNPESFRYHDDLKKIPTLTRKDLQTNKIFSDEYDKRKCCKAASSGSTGIPIIFYHDKIGLSANKAAVLICKYLGGWKGEKMLILWGNQTTVKKWNTLASRVSSVLFNEVRFPSFKLNNEQGYFELYNILTDKGIKFIYGYANAIYLFAEFLNDHDLKLNLKGVFTTAEMLLDYQRKTIETYLGHVYDHYGCKEVNGIACQTIYDNFYTVIRPHAFLEYINYSDEMKRLVITSLHNYSMPFIRYENDDLITLCGDKIKLIDGRLSDIIKLPGGGTFAVPGYFGGNVLKDFPEIKRYQLVKRKDNIELNILADSISYDKLKLLDVEFSNDLPKSFKHVIVLNKDFIIQGGKFKHFVNIE
jgi:phenylacetate-CoA ligase